MTQLINHTNVRNTYAGADGCACGCNGIYATAGATLTRRVNTVNQAIANGEPVAVLSGTTEDVYEYIKPNGRVIRVYVEKNSEMNTTATPSKLINEAEYLGYRLLIDDGYTVVTPLDRESFTAEVHKSFRGPWGVETTSYGLISPEDVDMVIDGLKRAQELVKLLNDAGL